MSIDWITVTAQIVNFLILVALLKRFLYQPVVQAMDRREQHIAERLAEAGDREQRADRRADDYRTASDALARDREQILQAARDEAERQKQQLLEEARRQADEARSSWQRQVLQERDDFLSNLRRQTGDAVQAVARRAIRDLADMPLEARIVDSFVERLMDLDADAREALAAGTEPAVIASAFELDAAVRGRLTRAVHDVTGRGIEVTYVRSPELVCGIALTRHGRRLGWSVADYLEELATRVEAALMPAERAMDAGR